MSLIQISGEAIGWWEARRIPFNLILLGVGAASTALLMTVFPLFLFFEGGPVILAGAIIGYGIVANVLYTLGWVTELIWSQGNTESTREIRPKVYRAGLLFSIALTAAPAYLAVIIFLIRLIYPLALQQPHSGPSE